MANQPKRAFHTASEPRSKRARVSTSLLPGTIQILKPRACTSASRRRSGSRASPGRLELGICRHRGSGGAPRRAAGGRVGHGRGDDLLRSPRARCWSSKHLRRMGVRNGAARPALPSGIATKAARCKRAAGDRQVISFGARRLHPALAPMIERTPSSAAATASPSPRPPSVDADPTAPSPHALRADVRRHGRGLEGVYEVIARRSGGSPSSIPPGREVRGDSRGPRRS